MSQLGIRQRHWAVVTCGLRLISPPRSQRSALDCHRAKLGVRGKGSKVSNGRPTRQRATGKPLRMLLAFEVDYRWLSQVYTSVQPTIGAGRLIWHALGAKTIELIHQNVHVDEVRDDLETLIIDAQLLEAVMGSPDPSKRSKVFETKLIARPRSICVGHDPPLPHPPISGVGST